MVLLHKLTWKEFEKIIQIIKDYKPIAISLGGDNTWFEGVTSLLSRVRKVPYNIEVGDLEKEDFRRIAVIVDMWNAVRPQTISYDSECDEVSSKLQRAFFKTYNEHVFPKE
jgi:hypothetical protein